MSEAHVYSVRQINQYIKSLFAQDYALRHITVKGEVSNCKYHTSGHIYFTLKDDSGVLSCIMFAGNRSSLAFRMREGQKVLVSGAITVYDRGGSYHLYAQNIQLDGEGDLYVRFQRKKQELEEMGMFDPVYKRAIPPFCRKIGIATAPTGAVIRDIQNIAFRRNPYVELILYPVYVQGAQAVPSIVRGLEVLDSMQLDCIIVGRGGGSIEDLWAFNDEAVARAIFDCSTPVISAVGHETDFTIADFVADMRAPTPSAAAELAVFRWDSFLATLDRYRGEMAAACKRQLDDYRHRLENKKLRLELAHPVSKLNQERQYLDVLQERLMRAMEQRLAQYRQQTGQRQQLEQAMSRQIVSYRQRLQVQAAKLQALSPLARLTGGFAYVEKEEHRVERAADLQNGEIVTIHFQDGLVKAKIVNLHEEQL